MMLGRIGPSDEAIKTLSFCFQIVPLKENAVFVQQSFISFFKVFFVTLC